MTDQIPPWGCPWHGLITAGKLGLPNGAKIDMRQPDSGNTSIIDFGAPEVLSQPPIETGKQWWNKAILSGDQIHGQPIGGSWVYQAPDLSLWLVSTTLHDTDGTDSSITVTLDSFGKFGFKKVTHTYTVPMVDLSGLQQEFYDKPYTILDYLVGVKVNRASVHPQGSASVFEVSSQFRRFNDLDGTISYGGARAPIAFLELKLDGQAEDCTVTLDRIYADRSMQSVYSDDPGGDDPLVILDESEWALEDTLDGCSGYYLFTESYGASSSGGLSTHSTLVDRAMLSVVYSEAGELVPITLTASVDNRVQSTFTREHLTEYRVYYAMAVIDGGCRFTEEDYQSGTHVDTTVTTTDSECLITIKAGDSEIYSRSASSNKVYTVVRRVGNNPSQVPVEDRIPTTGTWGWTATIEYGGQDTQTLEGGGILGVDAQYSPNYDFSSSWYAPFYRVASNPLIFSQLVRTSNNCMSVKVYTGDPLIAEYEPVIITVDGSKPADTITHGSSLNSADDPVLYGSFNPITKKAARALDSQVCYT